MGCCPCTIFLIILLLLHRSFISEATYIKPCQEGQHCSCNGTVYYGKRFVNGKPGSGAETSLRHRLDTDYFVLTKELSGRYLCSVQSFRGDPFPGYDKHCLCLSAEILPPPLCGPTAEPMSEHRVAVGFYGHTRLMRIALPTFKKHIFDVLDSHGINFDVFATLHFEASGLDIQDASFEQDEYEVRMMRPCATIISQNLSSLGESDDRVQISMKELHSMTSAYAHHHGLKYDAVLFMRLDRAVKSDFDLPRLLLTRGFSSSHVYIPRTAESEDRIAFASPDVMMKYIHLNNLTSRSAESLPPPEATPFKFSSMGVVSIKDNDKPIQGYPVEPEPQRLEKRMCGVSSSEESIARVAVGFHGLSRNLRLTLPTIRRHVFDVLQRSNITYDVFWSTVTVPVLNNSRSKESGAEIDEYDLRLMRPCAASLLPMYKVVNETSFNYTNISRHFQYKIVSPYKNMLCSLETQKVLDKMIRSHASRYGINYDAVLSLRPDTAVVRDVDLAELIASKKFSSKYIYLPDFAQFKGVNDRAAFGSPRVMSIYFNRKSAFMTCLSTNTNKQLRNTETFLKHYLAENHVPDRKSTLRVIRVRADGSVPLHDTILKLKYMQMPKEELERCQMTINSSTFLDTTMC